MPDLSTHTRVLITAAVALATGLAPQLIAQEDSSGETIVVTTTAADLPERVRRHFSHYLKSVPDGTRVRVTLGEFFDFGHSSSTEQMEPYIQCMVPVDERDRPHGHESFFNTRSPSPDRTVPWEHGTRQGAEKHYARGEKKPYVVEEIPWVKDAINGVRKSFHADGTLRSETTYVKGHQHGASRAYDTGGSLTRVAIMKNGVREGRMTDYWPGTKTTKRVIDYDGGLVNGWMREYHPNGKLKREIPFKKDRMHGIERELHPNGKPIRTRYWVDGDAVPEAVFKQRFK